MEVTKEQKLDLADHLEALSNREIYPENRYAGICKEVGYLFSNIYYPLNGSDFITPFLESWDHYTGSSMYPVPHDDLHSMDAYHLSNDLWGNSPYGDMRRDLCRHIAMKIREEI